MRDISPAVWPWPKGLTDQQVEQLTDDVLGKMSLSEKVAQLSGDGGIFALLKLGFYVLGLKRFPNMYSGDNQRLGIPPLSFSDGPRGIVIGNATCFPVAMARGAAWDVELERKVGIAIGKEARASGANYFAGLCVNLLRHPAWGRAQETYGEDSHHLGEMGIALMRGVQSQNVMVCAKHFAVNSIENSRFYLDVKIDERTLHEVYLPHFRALVDAGVESFMSAYNQLNGTYCGHSPELLTRILRDDWGFTGFISSDWLWGIYTADAAIMAGMDVEMPYARYYGKKLVRAVEQGRVPQEKIDQSARRVLRAKLKYAARDEQYVPSAEVITCEAHRRLAQDVAEQSMVLLKNTQQVLPLNKSSVRKLAVIGELAALPCIGDHGSSRVSPPEVVTFLQGLQEYLHGTAEIIYCDGSDIAAAQAIAREADAVVITAGYYPEDEGENLTSNRKPVANPKVPRGGDRLSLSLCAAQIALINAVAPCNTQTVVAVVAGSAVMMEEWQHNVPAILMAWYPGMYGGNALARILFGEVNPSGKLPFTIPANTQQLPAFDCWAEHAQYNYHHGYTLLDELQQTPAYAFGHGLSYTQFAIEPPMLEHSHIDSKHLLLVSVRVTNTGKCAGAEVVQCYAGKRDPNITPAPHKKLVAFQKVWLQPGETVCVAFTVPVSGLARYQPDSRSWAAENGEYQLWIGGSSAEDRLQMARFTVECTAVKNS